MRIIFNKILDYYSGDGVAFDTTNTSIKSTPNSEKIVAVNNVINHRLILPIPQGSVINAVGLINFCPFLRVAFYQNTDPAGTYGGNFRELVNITEDTGDRIREFFLNDTVLEADDVVIETSLPSADVLSIGDIFVGRVFDKIKESTNRNIGNSFTGEVVTSPAGVNYLSAYSKSLRTWSGTFAPFRSNEDREEIETLLRDNNQRNVIIIPEGNELGGLKQPIYGQIEISQFSGMGLHWGGNFTIQEKN